FLLLPLFCAALAAQSFAQDTAAAAADVLPPPTGAHGVGRVSFHWADASRAEALSKEPGARRELMVHLYYPTRPGAAGGPARYFPEAERVRDYEERRFGKGFMREEFGDSYEAVFGARTHTVEGAPLPAGRARYPVLVFMPGLGVKVFLYTALVEELASRGYVVAAVETPYDTDTVVFPGGRVVEQSDDWNLYVGRDPDAAARFHLARIDVNAADAGFVLDQLERLDSGRLKGAAVSFKGRLDVRRAGVLGHSQGGLAARRACQTDARWRACANLDGGLRDKEIETMGREPVRAPLMLMTGHFTSPKILSEQRAQFRGLRAEGYKVSVKAPGFGHFIYYDLELPEAKQEASRNGLPTAQRRRDTQIIRAYALAFFDKYLRALPQPLLDAPQTSYPEVTVEKFPADAPRPSAIRE
ncbi:MAG: hypothetical protein M3348_17340, partial [Acidobacteriota bacterium]|nr:hypothetical protein [Acidobacteriota bacterium]